MTSRWVRVIRTMWLITELAHSIPCSNLSLQYKLSIWILMSLPCLTLTWRWYFLLNYHWLWLLCLFFTHPWHSGLCNRFQITLNDLWLLFLPFQPWIDKQWVNINVSCVYWIVVCIRLSLYTNRLVVITLCNVLYCWEWPILLVFLPDWWIYLKILWLVIRDHWRLINTSVWLSWVRCYLWVFIKESPCYVW
jgi:hypothetical protein